MSRGVVGSYSWWWKCSRMYCVGLQPRDSMTSCWMAHFAQEDYTPGQITSPVGQSCALCASEIIQIFVILTVFITLVWSHVLAGHSLEWRGSHACCRLKCWSPFIGFYSLPAFWVLSSAVFISIFVIICALLYSAIFVSGKNRFFFFFFLNVDPLLQNPT